MLLSITYNVHVVINDMMTMTSYYSFSSVTTMMRNYFHDYHYYVMVVLGNLPSSYSFQLVHTIYDYDFVAWCRNFFFQKGCVGTLVDGSLAALLNENVLVCGCLVVFSLSVVEYVFEQVSNVYYRSVCCCSINKCPFRKCSKSKQQQQQNGVFVCVSPRLRSHTSLKFNGSTISFFD